MEKIRTFEKTRVFCCHCIDHLLDVARLAYIEVLERKLFVSREKVYAAALLHDLGRAEQYEKGIPHDLAGTRLADQILRDCDFSEEDRAEILEAVSGHRKSASGEEKGLPGILYRADKASRQCLFCDAQKDCNWPDEKKNLELRG